MSFSVLVLKYNHLAWAFLQNKLNNRGEQKPVRGVKRDFSKSLLFSFPANHKTQAHPVPPSDLRNQRFIYLELLYFFPSK